MVVGVLIFLALVLVGAGLNLVSGAVGLGLIPEFPGWEWSFIAKNYIADLILWVIVAVLLSALYRIARDRLTRRRDGPFLDTIRQPLSSPRIAVALTAYNDELSIGDAVRDFRAQPGVETVIVVDNNCRDGTAACAREAGAIVVPEPNQGYGWACQRGLRATLETGADVIVLSEGDGTFSGSGIAKMMPFLADADMVVGNRITAALVHRHSQMDSFFVWGNQLGAKLLQLRFWDWRFLGKARLSDLGCTYRAIRREALAEIIDELSVGGNHFSPHMIMVSMRQGHAVVEVPIRFRPRVGLSKGASSIPKAVGIGLAMLWHILTFPTGQRRPAVQPRVSTAVK